MNQFLVTLQRMDLHPVVDHFTVSLLIIGVLIDVIASAAPSRTWMRYMALTLMILGAIAAGCSYFSGDMEADRIWNTLSTPAKEVLHRHAMLGEYFAVVFGVLAVWRILIEGVGFFSGSRSIYLIVAIVSVGVLGYIGHLGGELVYDYGAGTAVAGAPPAEVPPATPGVAPTPEVPNAMLPTVSVPAPIFRAPTPGPVMTPQPPEATAIPAAQTPLPTAAATP